MRLYLLPPNRQACCGYFSVHLISRSCLVLITVIAHAEPRTEWVFRQKFLRFKPRPMSLHGVGINNAASPKQSFRSKTK